MLLSREPKFDFSNFHHRKSCFQESPLRTLLQFRPYQHARFLVHWTISSTLNCRNADIWKCDRPRSEIDKTTRVLSLFLHLESRFTCVIKWWRVKLFPYFRSILFDWRLCVTITLTQITSINLSSSSRFSEFFDKIAVAIFLDVLFRVFRFSKA